MKTSHTKLKSSLLLSLLVTSFPLLAKPVAQIVEVKGQVFAITPEGKTKVLRKNDLIEDRSEIMVGEEGDVTLNDYYDATYHLIEGSHLKLFDKSVQLKKGKSWIQSLNSKHPLSLTTANGHVDYWKGEFITTFDQASSKTQVLVVSGEVEVSNVLDKNMKYTVTGGNFTVVDPEAENGLPRTPTKIGVTSMNHALAEFKALPAKMKNAATAAAREIASVPEEKAPVAVAPVAAPVGAKKGEVIFMLNGKSAGKMRDPASAEGAALSYFKKKVTVAKSVKSVKLTSAPIRFYGMSEAPAQVKTAAPAPRQPASVKPTEVLAVPKKVGSDLNIDAEFSNSLRLEQASQPKHSKELENLIQDLKSY